MQQRNSQWRMFLSCCGFIGLLLSVAAQAEAVTTISPQPIPTPPVGSPTVSLFQPDGSGALVDVTDSYLPRVNEVVYVRMSDNTIPALVSHSPTAPLLPPATLAQLNPYLANLTTSAYQGEATNYPSTPSNVAPPALTDDFMSTGNQVTIGASTAHEFKALDYGGMLVVQHTGGAKYIIPNDSNTDGIPDSWFNSFLASLPAASQAREVDIDPGPGANAAVGDGISNFDEYRGFMVSGAHVRGDPRVKNAFVHLVNPQCGAATNLTNSELFANLNTLITGTQVFQLGFVLTGSLRTTEWVDHFDLWEENQTVSPGISRPKLLAGTDLSLSDRRINQNAVYPMLDPLTGLYIQKGIRISECVDGRLTNSVTNGATAYGSAGQGTPNGPGDAVIFTERMRLKVEALVGGNTPQYSNYVNGAWQTAVTTTKAEIVQLMIQYYIAMEIGHSVKLTPTVEGTRKVSYGYHHAPGAGTNMDQTFVYNSSTKVFSIPSIYSTPDKSNFKLLGF